ncbi:MAG: HU family DNA-binding protein [Clostridia bacterium]|nr:HU family DNA-binding protein [Clostridia bacterium]
MTKTELIAKVSEETKLPKKEAAAAVKATLSAISAELVKGEKVILIGFGTFLTRERAAHTGRNPSTGDTIKIPAAKYPAFKPGRALKTAVNVKPAKKTRKKKA